ncbi:MAG: indole-3-glycerol phosphate synthase TrpC [Actinomycetota bacterium]|nr:indole-3-glycerol phosphate synthase TrpC [Actinomycetota bacterium]MDI6821634.1 indole-3-glycerol phosphate synthase TrpC [Actinomycetota bacterium]
MILNEIIRDKRCEIEQRKKNIGLETLRERISSLPPTRDFKAALKKPGLSFIAEVKRASPSAGVIREDFNPAGIARVCEGNGAAAISVLTDRHFQGSLQHLKDIRAETSIPILRKDFIIDEFQVYESRASGADAILLIANILSIEEISKLLSLARKLDLDVIVEVHNRQELKKVLKTNVEIIGINNRNLSDFKVDISVTPKLIGFIPKNKIVVSESGIHTAQDVEFLKEVGVNAILVGEALMRSDDIAVKIRELLGSQDR